MSDTAITSTGATPSAESTHELPLHTRVGRARAGVLLLILSDLMMVASILAAGGYLSALNSFGMFKASTDQPAFPPGLIVSIVLVLSGLCYFWWARGTRQGKASGQQAIFVVALLLMIVGLAAQIWVWLNLGYITPPTAFPSYDAFQSVVLLLTAFNTVHLALTTFVGILLSGRMMNGRLAGQEYVIQAVGLWWYYTVISAVIMWVFIVLL